MAVVSASWPGSSTAFAAQPSAQLHSVEAPHLRVSLLSERPFLEPGGQQQFALRLEPQAGWHTYWKNPGGSGKPTRLEWQLPAGMRAGELQWPVPERINFAGTTIFGYQGEAALLVDIAMPPRDALQAMLDDIEGDLLPIRASASWLVCHEVCVQGAAELALHLPLAAPGLIADTAEQAALAQAFAGWRGKLPRQLQGAPASYQLQQGSLRVEIGADSLPVLDRQPDVLFAAPGVVSAAERPRVSINENGLTITANAHGALVEPPAFLPLLLKPAGPASATRAINVLARFDATPSALQQADAQNAGDNVPEANARDRSLPLILLFALLGGLVLNAMPCVFPVLSLKVISLVEHGGHSTSLRRRHGLAYAAGVVSSFLLVAAVLIALRAAGEQIGWGFQLQAPGFVALLIYVLFMLGLSLSGVLEFGGALQNIGQAGVANSSPMRASFLTGVLATVVATPCTAPFMGTAMGFALTQPLWVALLTFAVLGLGLALPFLLIAFIPALANSLPAPGNWMVRLKELLAFPIYLTVVWLLWVFARQVGVDAAAALLVGMVCLALALWCRRVSQFGPRARMGLVAALIAGGLAIMSLLWSLQLGRAAAVDLEPQNSETHAAAGDKKAWSQARLDAALAAGKTVLVNMTADWCITCKVNERVALSRDEVKRALARPDVEYLVGDWTNSDPAISRYLESFKRNGVPLYIVYKPGRAAQMLPQVLTQSIVLDALR
ncbi:MAG: thiol:disulfide interchange protein [Pseudomonadales bacterium]|nr:thiol:disulfide interchange protein [Pseudomonadales bacterium]